MDNDVMDTRPFGLLFTAMVLLIIGAELLLNLNEGPEIFIIFALVFLVPGAFLLISSAVAFGMHVARRR